MPQWLKDWLSQPSTLRALNALATIVGVVVSPEMWQQIVALGAIVWALIDGFYNQQPRKPE
jgi:hypothetical protein